jgi:hypothetical protein
LPAIDLGAGDHGGRRQRIVDRLNDPRRRDHGRRQSGFGGLGVRTRKREREQRLRAERHA